jgi:hypothetical protein
MGLGGPPPRPNTVEDALQAALELEAPRKPQKTVRLPFWWTRRPGHPVRWTNELGLELVLAVQARVHQGASFVDAVRAVARSKEFGDHPYSTLRRRYFYALQKQQNN